MGHGSKLFLKCFFGDNVKGHQKRSSVKELDKLNLVKPGYSVFATVLAASENNNLFKTGHK